jgi:GNAT superfamily N-acetyltransferase
MQVMEVRSAIPEDSTACVAIVRGLPDYFTDDVPDKVAREVVAHAAWVVLEADDVVGFAIVEQRGPRAAEILWMAVGRDHRGRGRGSALLEHVLEELSRAGVAVVEAKTLDASAGYEPYVATRAFWERHGFVQIDTIDPLPDWQPGNPAAIYVCALESTR